MRVLRVVAAWLGLVFVLGAQQPNTVSATVSTTQALTAATANFQVQFLDASLSSTVDTAIAVVGGTGASAANLTRVSVSISQGFVVTQYDFLVSVPADQFAATRDKLIAAQRAVANVNTQAVSWSTSYAVSEEVANRALEQAMPNLLNQARQQAGVLAAAMGAKLGDIVTMSAPAIATTALNASVTLTATFAVTK